MHHCPSLVRARRTIQRGLTMVELLVSITIIGILATIAVSSIRKYVAAAKASEAARMVRTIKDAQDYYYGERGKYVPVSAGLDGTGDFYPNNPTPGRTKMNFPGTGAGASAWQTLNVHEDAPVLFVYACKVGTATEKPVTGDGITVANWPSAPLGMPWYVIKARADLDGDGVNAVFLATSFNGEIFSAED